MNLTDREKYLLAAWKRQLEFDNRRLSKGMLSALLIKRKSLNNERIELIEKLIKA